MSKVRVAVIGYGHLGKWHCQKVEANKNLADFVAIVEKFEKGQALAKENHPGVRIVLDITEVLNQIDAAFIVTPTSTHAELVAFLLENGKHVFCEKPLCSNDEEAIKLKSIAQSKNLILQVGHSERFHEAWEKLRAQFNELKPPYLIRINRAAPFKGRATDVDVVQDLAIHDLDLLMFLFNEKPLSVRARGLKIRTQNWDHAQIFLKMEKGSEAEIVVGRNHTHEMRDLEVISSTGMIHVDLFRNTISKAPAGSFEDGSFVKTENYSKRDHLLLEHENFYRSILENIKPVVGLKDGLAAVHLVDRTLEALRTQSEVPVQLPK
jgi:predicted dehydrogenase